MSFFKPFDRINSEVKDDMLLEHIGIVVDNSSDPLKLGRIKCYIPIFEEIPVENLPYCSPKLPTFLGLSTQSISFSIPELGSSVLVTFPTRDKYNPEYALATLTNSNKCTSTSCNFFDDTYPNSYGFKDSGNNSLKITKSPIPANNFLTLTCAGTATNNSNIAINNATTSITNNTDSLINNAENSISDNCNVREINATQQIDLTAPVINLNALVNISTGVSGIFATLDGRFLEFTNGILTNVT